MALLFSLLLNVKLQEDLKASFLLTEYLIYEIHINMQHKLTSHAEMEVVWSCSSNYCEPRHSETLKTPDHELFVCK